jgi:hypothetical protein
MVSPVDFFVLIKGTIFCLSGSGGGMTGFAAISLKDA